MVESKPDIEAQLRALRDAYIAKLPAKVDELWSDWRVFIAAPWNAASAAELHRMLHSLAGSSGTFGLSEMTHTARKAEELLKLTVERQQHLTAEESAELGRQLDTLKAMAETALGREKLATPAE